MSETGTTLQQLHRQLARKRKVDLMLEDLQTQLTELEEEAAYLHEAYLAEEDDLQRLEGESFSALLYRLMGTLEEKRSQSEAELYAAAMKYETAQRQLEDVLQVAHAILTTEEQRTLESHFIGGLTTAETAMLESVPESTIRGRISRIRRKLKKHFPELCVLLLLGSYIK